MTVLGKFFQSAACVVGLHNYGEEQTRQNAYFGLDDFKSVETRRVFRCCANAGCKGIKGKETVFLTPCIGAPTSWTNKYRNLPPNTPSFL